MSGSIALRHCLNAMAMVMAVGAGAAAANAIHPGSRAMIAPSAAIGPVEQRLLNAHNRERALFGSPPLRWDPGLAAAAATYGPALSAMGRLQHSPRTNRPGQAENLWMGTRGAFPLEVMVGAWNDERRYFRPGIFPDVSTTGNWQDVAHFTQVIWKGTTHVGCSVYRDARYEFLICRYSPKGNADGRRVP